MAHMKTDHGELTVEVACAGPHSKQYRVSSPDGLSLASARTAAVLEELAAGSSQVLDISALLTSLCQSLRSSHPFSSTMPVVFFTKAVFNSLGGYHVL